LKTDQQSVTGPAFQEVITVDRLASHIAGPTSGRNGACNGTERKRSAPQHRTTPDGQFANIDFGCTTGSHSEQWFANCQNGIVISKQLSYSEQLVNRLSRTRESNGNR
jgi:hypothetical protein